MLQFEEYAAMFGKPISFWQKEPIGGKAYDITKMSKQERAKGSFDEDDF
jgi:hypothetical protein